MIIQPRFLQFLCINLKQNHYLGYVATMSKTRIKNNAKNIKRYRISRKELYPIERRVNRIRNNKKYH